MVLQVRPQWRRVQGKDHFPSSAGNTWPNIAKETSSQPEDQGILLARVQLGVRQDPRSFSAELLSS